MRYFPPNGTAGFARSRVKGHNRVPLPPASTMPNTFSRELPCTAMDERCSGIRFSAKRASPNCCTMVSKLGAGQDQGFPHSTNRFRDRMNSGIAIRTLAEIRFENDKPPGHSSQFTRRTTSSRVPVLLIPTGFPVLLVRFFRSRQAPASGKDARLARAHD